MHQPASDALALVRRLHVQVVEEEPAFDWLDCNKPNPLARNEDVACLLWIEPGQKPFSCSRWIESANAFEAFSHGYDAQYREFLSISLNCLFECDGAVFLQGELDAL